MPCPAWPADTPSQLGAAKCETCTICGLKPALLIEVGGSPLRDACRYPGSRPALGFRLVISPASNISAARRSRGTRSTQAWASAGSEA